MKLFLIAFSAQVLVGLHQMRYLYRYVLRLFIYLLVIFIYLFTNCSSSTTSSSSSSGGGHGILLSTVVWM